MIKVCDLSCALGGKRVLTNVSAVFRPGAVTGLIGPNGAGKSTLLHCLAGLLEPTCGSVSIDGLDPFAACGPERARAVALLQQSPAVVSRLRVHELVAFGRWPHHQGRATARDQAKVATALSAFDLEDLADRAIDSLSGGQRQRAFVAMTYAQDTPWILLDEPLNALDPKHVRRLMSRLYDLSRQEGRGIVVALHDIAAAARWTDQIVAMKAGAVLGSGPSAQILTSERLEQTFDTKFDTLQHRGRTVVVLQ